MEQGRIKRQCTFLIGRVKFYDFERGFGFIETNGFGINTVATINNSTPVELFFCYRDLGSQGEIVQEGDWVSFLYKKADEKKRDYAKSVRLLRYKESEYPLVLQYRGEYSNIVLSDNRGSVNVIISFLSGLVLRRPHQSVTVMNMLLDSYSNSTNITHEILYEDPLLRLVFEYDENALTRDQRVLYYSLLSDISAILVEMVSTDNTNIDYWSPILDRCISVMDNNGIECLRDLFCVNVYDAHYGKNGPKSYSVASVFNNLSKGACEKLFGSDNYDYPIIRTLVYERLGNSALLRHKSVIEYWNQEILNLEPISYPPYYDTIRSYKPRIKIPREIADYIASSSLSNDYLLLWAFVETANPDCFNHIKDKGVIKNWLPKLSDNYVYQFISYNAIIPKEIITDFCTTLGASRLVKILPQFGDSFWDIIPDAIKVYVNANLALLKEEQTTESSDWYGGYFTWGEGMKHQKYDIYTYNLKSFTVSVFAVPERSNFSFLTYLKRQREALTTSIRNCIEQKASKATFLLQADREEIVVCLSTTDSAKEDGVLLFRQPLQAKLLISTETIQD